MLFCFLNYLQKFLFLYKIAHEPADVYNRNVWKIFGFQSKSVPTLK